MLLRSWISCSSASTLPLSACLTIDIVRACCHHPLWQLVEFTYGFFVQRVGLGLGLGLLSLFELVHLALQQSLEFQTLPGKGCTVAQAHAYTEPGVSHTRN